MPAASKRKPIVSPNRGSIIGRVSASSQRQTPLRQSNRIKRNARGTLQDGPRKRVRIRDNESNSTTDRATSASHSDYHSQESDGEDEGVSASEDGQYDNDGPQSYSIPLPKAREVGDIPYEDVRIHPNTFLFLGDLKANNNRDWLKWNDKDFRISLKDFETFIEKLSDLVMERDPTIPGLPTKDIPHFSAAWSRTGKKGPYAAYYVQLQPGASFVGGGLWHPDGPALATIRESIDQQPHNFKGALMGNTLRKTFFENIPNDEKKVVAAFVATNAEGALKTKPKGFSTDHKDLNLLRLRNFTLGKKISDGDVLSDNGIMKIANIIGALVPWVTYLNDVVMPDPPNADSSEDN